MSLRQHYPESPAPGYPSTSRQTDRSVYSDTNTFVPPNQTGYDAKTEEWRKEQPDWRYQHPDRFAPPPQAYGRGYGDYGTPSGGFDPKFDHINNAPPTRDAKRKGVYGTMCCGSGWGVAAWIVGAAVVIGVLVVILLKLFVSSDCPSSGSALTFSESKGLQHKHQRLFA